MNFVEKAAAVIVLSMGIPAAAGTISSSRALEIPYEEASETGYSKDHIATAEEYTDETKAIVDETNGSKEVSVDETNGSEEIYEEETSGYDIKGSEGTVGDETVQSRTEGGEDGLLNSPQLFSSRAYEYGSYVDWRKHEWTASYNGKNLILSFDIDFYATGNGSEWFSPKYTFGYSETSYTPFNVLSCTSASSADDVQTYVGEVNVTEFTRTAGDSGEVRHLRLKGTITVDQDSLDTFTGGRFRYYAGGWSSGNWTAAENSDLTVDGFESALEMAQCEHTSFNYSSTANVHRKLCTVCGFSHTEAHSITDGKCTVCGYVAVVEVTLNYVLNGRTESEKLSLNPGESYQPKTISGYKKPAQITVPAKGGTVNVSYEPIAYTVTDGEESMKISYDDIAELIERPAKGYTHIGYRVTAV